MAWFDFLVTAGEESEAGPKTRSHYMTGAGSASSLRHDAPFSGRACPPLIKPRPVVAPEDCESRWVIAPGATTVAALCSPGRENHPPAYSFRQIASAISRVPTAVGSSRCGFMS
jgi:hypothetical protein